MRNKRDRKLIHGTLDGYSNHRCRCRRCKDVWELYTQEYREEVFDETNASYAPVRIPRSFKDYSERKEYY